MELFKRDGIHFLPAEEINTDISSFASPNDADVFLKENKTYIEWCIQALHYSKGYCIALPQISMYEARQNRNLIILPNNMYFNVQVEPFLDKGKRKSKEKSYSFFEAKKSFEIYRYKKILFSYTVPKKFDKGYIWDRKTKVLYFSKNESIPPMAVIIQHAYDYVSGNLNVLRDKIRGDQK